MTEVLAYFVVDYNLLASEGLTLPSKIIGPSVEVRQTFNGYHGLLWAFVEGG